MIFELELAINDRYPAPFEGLRYDEALALYFAARALTQHDDEIDEALLWEIRNMPECLRCAGHLSSHYPFGGHDEHCPARKHLRVVK